MAQAMAILTILYNLAEGMVSVGFGLKDETLSLFGFGLDSFIEMISGLGILAMILRIRNSPDTPRSRLESTALRVTGGSFHVLAAGLAAGALYNLATHHKPESTLPGVIISLISIAFMWRLVRGKRAAGIGLQCDPLLADANCTLVCIYMSVVLLAASVVYELTGFGYIDSLGAIGLVWLSIREGAEAFEKAGLLGYGTPASD